MKKKFNLENEVINIVKTVLNEKININSSQGNTKNWDSMAYLSILTSLEKKFNIKISQQNFNKFNSIKNIVKLINKK